MEQCKIEVCIIYRRYLDSSNQQRTIGGIQTYITNLLDLIKEMDWKALVYQGSERAFSVNNEGTAVVGIPVEHLPRRTRKKILVEAAISHISRERGVVIFASDDFSIPTSSRNCIAIQHGISWDVPVNMMTSRRFLAFRIMRRLRKAKAIRDAIRNFDNCPNRVCVDYNFLNWYRATVEQSPKGRVWVIPNFAKIVKQSIVEENLRRSAPLRVLFARRFTERRGTKIMAEVTRRVLRDFPNMQFTFAGEGPDEAWLRQEFAGDENVVFCKYEAEESAVVCSSHDISVVPSLGSEGTSLAVAEAMGAGCAVVASAVGGITNMILDGHNGLLCMPDAGSLESKLRTLIDDESLRLRIRRAGYRTASQTLSLDRWKAEWRAVLKGLVSSQ